MLISTMKKIFGTRNDRELKRMGKVVARINALEEGMQTLDDDALRAKTAEFRARLNEGATLEQLLPEAFAVVREAGVRALGMRHFDVQLIGGTWRFMTARSLKCGPARAKRWWRHCLRISMRCQITASIW